MTLTEVLFAGGKSRRMGRDKATLVLDGRPLWARQLGVLEELNPAAIWISAQVRPVWGPSHVEVVLDDPPSRGPLSGLAAALALTRTTHLLTLAIDLPRMTAAHLRKLWSVAQPGCGVIPRNGDCFEPLCAVYPREAFAEARRALTGSDVSLQSLMEVLLRENLVREYPVGKAEKDFYLNANCPADLRGVGG